MKLDYDLLKKILQILESDESFEIKTNELIQKLDDNSFSLNKFIGHMYELNDNGCFDCPQKDLGITRTFKGYLIGNAPIRLTAHGRQFLEALKNDRVFNKIKEFSVSTAIEAGKTLLQAIITTAVS